MQEIKDTYYSGAERKSADLTFYAAGSQQTKSDYQYGPIVRNYHVIHFVSRGCGTLTIRNKTYTVRSGQAFIIPAQIPASYKADFADPWDYSWISFLGLRSNGYVRQLLHACGNSFVTPTLPVRSYRDLIDKFLVDNSTHNGLSQSFRATALLYEVLSCLFRDLSIDSEPLSHHPMEEVKYFIEMNVGKDLKVHEIASRFGYHPNYLIRKFSETFGISPKQFILNLKMAKAKKLVEENQESIHLIADSLGFKDQTTFSRLFKKQFGISPSRCRALAYKRKDESR